MISKKRKYKYSTSTDFIWSSKKRRTDNYDEEEEDYEVERNQPVSCLGNRIYFTSEVTSSSVNQLVKIIEAKNFEYRMAISHELIQDAQPAPLYLHINSGGGDILAAMSAVDSIQRSYVPIHTVVDGKAASAASLISVSGVKRYITKHSYMMIHQLSSGVIGKYQDIEDKFENCKQFMDDIIEVYKDNTTLSDKKIQKLLKRDKWWNSKTCMKNGFVDSVLDGPEEPKVLDLKGLLEAVASGAVAE